MTSMRTGPASSSVTSWRPTTCSVCRCISRDVVLQSATSLEARSCRPVDPNAGQSRPLLPPGLVESCRTQRAASVGLSFSSALGFWWRLFLLRICIFLALPVSSPSIPWPSSGLELHDCMTHLIRAAQDLKLLALSDVGSHVDCEEPRAAQLICWPQCAPISIRMALWAIRILQRQPVVSVVALQPPICHSKRNFPCAGIIVIAQFVRTRLWGRRISFRLACTPVGNRPDKCAPG
mmetsp:Transcript_45595/g.118323  ORF Transcript_45595/g.118323 Transcript_45595/m.118323 type:complete len:235 (+) Transcript_45595:3-707(+)